MTIHKPNEFPKKKITNQCNHRSWVAKIESKENRLWKFVQLDVQLFVFPYSIATRKSENLRIFLAQELQGKSKILIKGIFAPRHTSLYPRSIEHFLFVFPYLRSQSRMCYNATGHVGVDQFVWCHRIVVTRATLLWLLPWERNLPFYAYPSFTPPLSLSLPPLLSSSQSILDARIIPIRYALGLPFCKSPRIIGFCQATVWFLYNKTSWEKEEKYRKNHRVYLYCESIRLHLIPFPFLDHRADVEYFEKIHVQHRCRPGGGIDEFMHPITFFNSSMV